MTWQPIETAPTEVRLLLWCADELSDPDNRMVKRPKGIVFGIVTTYPGLPNEPRGEGLSGQWTFTHWMPLPEPPAE
jgi:hypothetical protein